LFGRWSHVRLRDAVTSSHVARLGRAGRGCAYVLYAIVAVTVAAFALVAMLCTSSVSNELGRSLRLSWWFS
jgi:hypothetical protein